MADTRQNLGQGAASSPVDRGEMGFGDCARASAIRSCNRSRTSRFIAIVRSRSFICRSVAIDMTATSRLTAALASNARKILNHDDFPFCRSGLPADLGTSSIIFSSGMASGHALCCSAPEGYILCGGRCVLRIVFPGSSGQRSFSNESGSLEVCRKQRTRRPGPGTGRRPATPHS
jgi:hypothetical protein